MSHGLTKKDTMFSVGQTPWHKLGTILDAPPTIEEALKIAGLDWNVQLQDVWTAEGAAVPAKAVVREDSGDVLGAVGLQYTPLQNVAALKWFDRWIETGKVELETAGSLFGGRRVWALAKMKSDPIDVGGGDIVEKYILLGHSHDGSLAVRAGLTPIRVVCNNTLSWAVNDADASNLFRLQHRKNVVQKLEDVADKLDALDARLNDAGADFRRLAEAPVSGSKAVEAFVGAVYRQDGEQLKKGRRLGKITELFESGRGQDLKTSNGTHWGLYNALTEYVTHHQNKDLEKRTNGMAYGSGVETIRRGFDVAYVMATKQISIEDVFGAGSEIVERVDKAIETARVARKAA